VSLCLTFELLDHPEPLELLRAGVERVRQTEDTRIDASPTYTIGPGLAAVDLEVSQEPRVYQALLFVLLEVDLWERKFLEIPSVLAGGIRYEAEPPGVEWWRSSYAIRHRGAGDCEDLATDYAAELTLDGQQAAPLLELDAAEPGKGRRFHVVTLATDAAGDVQRFDISREIEEKLWD